METFKYYVTKISLISDPFLLLVKEEKKPSVFLIRFKIKAIIKLLVETLKKIL